MNIDEKTHPLTAAIAKWETAMNGAVAGTNKEEWDAMGVLGRSEIYAAGLSELFFELTERKLASEGQPGSENLTTPMNHN